MKTTRSFIILLVVAMLFSAGLATGCATKRQVTDLEAKVDQALSALGSEAVVIGQAVNWDESETRVRL